MRWTGIQVPTDWYHWVDRECRLLATSRPPVARNRLPLYLQERTFMWPRLTSAC